MTHMIWPGLIAADTRHFNWCIILHEEQHSDLMAKHPVMHHLVPSTALADSLNQMLGLGNWRFQSHFSNEIDCDRMALWFCTQEDQAMVKLMLMA